ncbi:MAG: HAMP domain-containing sensor histidine kinase, partial [Propionibacteriaceae bacterium]|nr:HAMP domain-containing sensor histidine kinase [Propionibacteriaceae bacterium]
MAVATPALVETGPAITQQTALDKVQGAVMRPPVPGRRRVVGWTVVVSALGLLVLMLGAAWALGTAADHRIQAGLAKEAAEVRRYAALGVDPATGEPFTTPRRFVAAYLDLQHPDHNELLLGTTPGTSWRAERRGDRTLTFGVLADAVQQRILTPGTGSARSPGHGRVSWQTTEVQAPAGTATIAVVAFHAPQHTVIVTQLGVLGLVAAVALAATGFAAWWVAGRLKAPTVTFEEAVARATAGGGVASLPEVGREDYARLARAANRLVASADQAYARETQLHHDLARQLEQPLATLHRALEDEARAQPGRPEPVQSLGRVRQVRNIVSDLLLLQRVELPGLLEPQPGISLTEFTEILVDLWATRAVELGAPGVTVERGACDPTAHATFDEPRLARAVDELIANAVSASSDDQIVWLSTGSWADERGQWVHIDVTDTGRGIPSDERALVLERFASARNDPSPGTGLGLTIAHRLVVAMGGFLTLTGHDGAPGTTARI